MTTEGAGRTQIPAGSLQLKRGKIQRKVPTDCRQDCIYKDLARLKWNAARMSAKHLQILDWFHFKQFWSVASRNPLDCDISQMSLFGAWNAQAWHRGQVWDSAIRRFLSWSSERCCKIFSLSFFISFSWAKDNGTQCAHSRWSWPGVGRIKKLHIPPVCCCSMVHHPTQSGALVRWINAEASNDESSNQYFQALPHHYQTRWTCVQRMAAAVGCTHVDATNTDAAINRTSNQCCKVLVTKVHCLSLNWVILQCITALNYSLVQCAVVVHQYGQYTSMGNTPIWAMHQYGQCTSITQHAATTLQRNLAKLC